ncbi:hypothetical protein [Anaerococcus octavius]|uniref:hypothetical protein n=1 Tax=Anaerococcus octavius TaxID=54007 RepID=UPI0027B8B302|nr:hypothetical protein [Anaerococcus octavius]
MKIKKYSKVLALSLAIGLIAPATNSFASESAIKIEKISTLENFDKASKGELAAYQNLLEEKNNNLDENPSLDQDLGNIAKNFGEEYKLRYDLKANIELIKKLDKQNFAEVIKDSEKILNSDDLEKVKTQSDYIQLLISQKQADNQVALTDQETQNIGEATTAFIEEGKLFLDEDNNNNEDIDQAIKAIQNSKNYYLADEKQQAKYDKLLKVASENKENPKANELLKEFLASPDKENFKIPDSLDSEEESEITNQNFTAGNTGSSEDKLEEESQTIENPSQATGNTANQSESAFIKNDKTSSKYKELSDAQKRELDAIDTNKDGKLSNEELDASANYTSNLGSDSWLYPFTEKALSESNTDGSQTDNGAENTNDEVSKDSENPSQEKEVPKTVTIDKETKSPELADEDKAKKNSEENKEENFNETEANQTVAPRENTNAASVVKTGIKSLGYVVGILIIALGAYYFLSKNQKNKK